MIPKIIHFCWFGRGAKPSIVNKCIDSWKRYLPDYKIMEWNEDNFNIDELKYTKDAYEAKKYAFVSDVARVKALYEYGGIYFDTDVEVLQSLDDEILSNRCVLGFELGNYVATSFMACEKGFPLMKEFFQLYVNLDFYDKEGKIISGTNVTKLTNMLIDYGLERNDKMQTLDNGIKVYPKEFFSPYDYGNCIYEITKNSFCVHHFCVSWMSKKESVKKKIKFCVSKYFGKSTLKNIRKVLRR